MTAVLFTIDTELSSGLHEAGVSAEENHACSITGTTPAGDFGIHWQMDQMEAHGVRGVYFVDPMPALVFGPAIVERIVAPILARGHEVQIHIHTEWLQWARQSPVHGRTGRNIGDFTLEDQVVLIDWARKALIEAGVPSPNAFRAGNFGANDDTLRALAELGIAWDSSYNPAYAQLGCRIGAAPAMVDPAELHGVLEVPVAGLWDRPGRFRPAQICAISATEMRQALRHAADTGAHSFSLVTHSFEMLSRDRRRPNRTVMSRLIATCRAIGADPRLTSSGFHALQPPTECREGQSRLGPNGLRTALRMAKQAVSTVLYDRRLKPI